MARSVLVIDDDPGVGVIIRKLAAELGVQSEQVGSVSAAVTAIEKTRYALAMVDFRLPDGSGFDVIQTISKDRMPLFFFMTAHGSTDAGVEAMNKGAFDYLEKPIIPSLLKLKMKIALQMSETRLAMSQVHEKRKQYYGFDRLRFRSKSMELVFNTAKRFAASSGDTLLITGESGVGKSFLAELIHYSSARASFPYVHVTCTTLSSELLESELFGHEKGAFTDAKSDKEGLAERAHGGTLFLDEIGEMTLQTQAKLLGFLDSQKFRRVGGVDELSVNLRVIAATNADLPQLVEDGKFRRDLYYRINVVHLELPPLRERREDIPVLAKMFAESTAQKLNVRVPTIMKDAEEMLLAHQWPGNLRELSNVIERCLIFSTDESLDSRVLARWLVQGDPVIPSLNLVDLNLERMQERLIKEAMKQTGNNQTKAAELLGITRAQIIYALKKEAGKQQ